MTDKLKYVICEDDMLEYPVLFPYFIDHSDVAKAFGGCVSAGVVRIHPPHEVVVEMGAFTMKINNDTIRQELDRKLIEFILSPEQKLGAR